MSYFGQIEVFTIRTPNEKLAHRLRQKRAKAGRHRQNIDILCHSERVILLILNIYQPFKGRNLAREGLVKNLVAEVLIYRLP